MNLVVDWFSGGGGRGSGVGAGGPGAPGGIGGAGGAGGIGGNLPGMPPHDIAWVWVTIILSLLVAAGYVILAVNWYFQSKLARPRESRSALSRLRLICLCCCVCGYVFYATDVPWLVWRIYDVVLLVFVFTTWSFILQTRGLGLINDRLAQVDKLERSATRYREIAELLPHMVWMANGQGMVDYSNRRWREYAGDEHRTWLEAVHPEEQEQVLARWNEAVAKRVPVVLETRLGGAEGYRTFIVRATPILHGGEQNCDTTAAVKWLGACADIEDQKLLAAAKELQARQKSFFLNALSHDLRAPLHNVLLNAQLLKMSPRRDEADAESVDMIVENALAAGDLVTKLLDFAKVGAQDDNAMESVPIAALLRQVVRRFVSITEQKGLYLRLAGDAEEQAEGAMRVMTDRRKLERILSNLVDNAVKYTQRGGVSIELLAEREGDPARGRDNDNDSGDVVRVRVRDTGIGVAAGNVPYLFDEFYQVNNYERDRSKGFGMGLAICRSLAGHIGAEVRLHSTGPEGSCFEVALSAVQPKHVLHIGQEVRADRGRRPGGEAGDRGDSQSAGLCRI